MSPTDSRDGPDPEGDLPPRDPDLGEPQRDRKDRWARAKSKEPRRGPELFLALTVVLAFLVVLVAGGYLFAQESAPDAVQPIEFNHKVHIDGDVDCLQCHEGLLDSYAERLPTLEVCTGCHDADEDPEGRQELIKLRRLARDETVLAWDPMLRLPDHVYFSHLRHVDLAELECVDCHGDMPERTSPPRHRRIVTMEDCIACHEEHSDRPSARRATLDCAACHR